MDFVNSNVGRFVFAIPFLLFGVFHFMGASDMASMVPSFIPGGVIWVYLTGVALVAAAISFMIKKKTKLAGLLLALMLLIFIGTIHVPAIGAGGDAGQLSVVMALKDLALAGAAIFIGNIIGD